MTFPPAAPRGIGLTTPQTPPVGGVATPVSSPAPSSPAPTSSAPAPKSTAASIGIPQMQDDPIAAIGFVLQEFAAGLQGRELPSTRLKREAMQQRQLELQQMEVGARVMEQGLSLIERTPVEERQRVVDAFTSDFADAMPGMRDMLLELSHDIPGSKEVLSAVGEFAPQIYAVCRDDVACIRKYASDEGFMSNLRKIRDEQNLPIVGSKMREITSAMHTNPDVVSGLARDSNGSFVLTFADIDRLNDTLPEELQLSQSEINTLHRNPHVMAAFGIKTPEIINEEQKALARHRIDRAFTKPDLIETERDGQKFHTAIDPFSGNVLFELPAGKITDKFDTPSFKAALALRAAGEDLPEGAFSDAITQAVAPMDPATASNVRAGLDSGGMSVVTHPDGTTEVSFGAAAGDTTAAKAEARVIGKERGEAKVAVQRFGADIANVGNLLRRANEMGESATGLRAVAMDTLGGYLEQYSPGASGKLGGLLDKVLGGKTASIEEISQFRAQARVAIAQNIETVSGEESGRFTEMERRVTEETMKVLEVGASKGQIISAVSELLKLKLMLREFATIKAGMAPRWDFEADEGRRQFVQEMLGVGLDPHHQKDLAQRIMELRSQVQPVFSGE